MGTSDESSFHVAGILVLARPRRAKAVGTQIARLAGSKVHAITPEGKLVVTIESEDPAHILECMTQIQRLPAVLSAVLVSEHNDPAAIPKEERAHDNENHSS